MIRAYKLRIAGRAAIIAALMGGSSLSLAQDSAPAPASAVAPPAAVETTIAPPAAVRTLPTANDVVNPAAAQEAATEVSSQRQVAAAPKPRTAPVRANTPVAAAPVAPIAAESVSEPSADVSSASAVTEVSDGTPIIDTTDIAPTKEVAAPSETSFSNEDITLFGGIAAALAAIGLGAAFASRRRRRVVAGDRTATVTPAPGYIAPRPIREDPAFQKFAVAPKQEHAAQRAPNLTRSDVPVTDPLFSTPVTAGPIIDPLFAPKTVVEQPITDPLFANNDRFTSRSRSFEATQSVTPEPVN